MKATEQKKTTASGYKKAVGLVNQALNIIGVGAGLPTSKRMKVLRDRRALIRVKGELEAARP